jgi:purine-cytosine permease-like protein
MGAWLPAAFVGLSFVNLPGQLVGPFGSVAGGLDLSVPVSLALGGVLYVLLLTLFPEPDGVYGPHGRRFVRSGRRTSARLGAPAIQPKGY